jgi:hypothetical protein
MLHNLHYTPNRPIIRMMEYVMGGACSTHGNDEKYAQPLIETLEGKNSLGSIILK